MRLKWNFNIENTSFFIVLLWIYTLKIKNPLAKLHNEIIEFFNYVGPSSNEHVVRTEVKYFINIKNNKLYISDI